jgi:hypothetical protein
MVEHIFCHIMSVNGTLWVRVMAMFVNGSLWVGVMAMCVNSTL